MYFFYFLTNTVCLLSLSAESTFLHSSAPKVCFLTPDVIRFDWLIFHLDSFIKAPWKAQNIYVCVGWCVCAFLITDTAPYPYPSSLPVPAPFQRVFLTFLRLVFFFTLLLWSIVPPSFIIYRAMLHYLSLLLSSSPHLPPPSYYRTFFFFYKTIKNNTTRLLDCLQPLQTFPFIAIGWLKCVWLVLVGSSRWGSAVALNQCPAVGEACARHSAAAAAAAVSAGSSPWRRAQWWHDLQTDSIRIGNTQTQRGLLFLLNYIMSQNVCRPRPERHLSSAEASSFTQKGSVVKVRRLLFVYNREKVGDKRSFATNFSIWSHHRFV